MFKKSFFSLFFIALIGYSSFAQQSSFQIFYRSTTAASYRNIQLVRYQFTVSGEKQVKTNEVPVLRPEIQNRVVNRNDMDVRLAHLDISSKSSAGHVIAPLHLSGPTSVQVKISDMTGKEVKSFQNHFSEGGYKEWYIDMHNMRDGVYILTFSVNGERTVKKIVKDDIRMA